MRYLTFFILLGTLAFLTGCGSQPASNNNSANANSDAPAKQSLSEVERPQSVKI